MRIWKKVLTCLLVLSMVPMLPAAARSDVVLDWQSDGDRRAELELTGLEDSVYAVQLDLTLEGRWEEVSFSPADEDVYSPRCRILDAEGGGTLVSLYLTSRFPLNRGARLSLGTLRADQPLPRPKEAQLTLLDRELKPLPEADGTAVELRGGGTGSSGSESGYRVRLEQPDHGTLRASPTWAEEGETVTLTVRPNAGYILDTLEVEDRDQDTVRLRERDEQHYTFTMPDGQVRVTASFRKDGDAVWDLPFTDVTPEDWFCEAAGYVYRNGLMLGTTETTFAPQVTTNRGMIVTILHRLEGAPAAGPGGFTDVPADMYCADAVAWANANGIVNGYGNGKFGPRNTITRQQLAAILYRYAVFKGYSTGGRGDLTDYTDRTAISPYAEEAMSWAVGNVLVFGDQAGLLSPQAGATRAQAAFALTGLCLDIAEETP